MNVTISNFRHFDDNQIADITKLGKAGYIFIWKL